MKSVSHPVAPVRRSRAFVSATQLHGLELRLDELVRAYVRFHAPHVIRSRLRKALVRRFGCADSNLANLRRADHAQARELLEAWRSAAIGNSVAQEALEQRFFDALAADEPTT